MDTEGTVEPQAETVQEVQPIVEQVDNHEAEIAAHEERTQVPLSALQKERKKRQELELELQWVKQNQPKAQVQAPEEDNSRYESATREDLSRAQEEAIRAIEEKMWIKSNPEKYERINDQLPQFLKQRPNLASAINSASNRYEEAYLLMDALTPKQQAQLKTAALPKKEAPHSPSGVPKAASLNQAVDVMNMSDTEFSAWRSQQKKRR